MDIRPVFQIILEHHFYKNVAEMKTIASLILRRTGYYLENRQRESDEDVAKR